MDVFKIAVKLFVVRDDFSPDQFVPIFHRWIQNQAVEHHLLIDVADYAHVKDGPGTVLVASEANFHMDRTEGRLGILYSRKTPLPGSFADRLSAVIAEALKAASRLEAEPGLKGRISFATNEIVIRLNDRLAAPNTEATRAAAEPAIRAVAEKLFGGKPVSVETRIQPHTEFEVRVNSEGSASVSALLNRLSANPVEAGA
jgi:hypothetical protein